MTREQFIEEIEKRGLKKRRNYNTWVLGRENLFMAFDEVNEFELVNYKSGLTLTGNISAITVELINAVAGKEKP